MSDKKLNRDELREKLDRANAVIEAIRENRVDAVVGRESVSLLRVAETEHKLRRAQTRLQVALEASGGGVYERASPPDRSSWYSQTWSDLTGYLPDEIPRDHSFQDWFFERVHPEDRLQTRRAYLEFLEGRTDSFQSEYRFRHKEGRWFWLRDVARAVERKGGRVRQLAGIVLDIEAQKQREEELRASRLAALNLMEDAVESRRQSEESSASLASAIERLRLASQAAGFGVYDFDPETEKMAWSAELYRIFGLSDPIEVDLKAFLEFVHPEDRAGLERTVREILSPDSPERHQFEYRFVRPEGEVRWAQDTGRSYCEGGGEERRIARVVGTVVDITEQRRAEESLRESEERFRTMAEGLPLIVWVHDAEGRQTYVNRTFREFFGLGGGELGGSDWRQVLDPEEGPVYVEKFLACVRNHRPFHARVRVRRSDGKWCHLESWGRPRFSPSGEFLGMIGTSADITNRVEAEAMQQRLADVLEKKVAARTAEVRQQAEQLRALAMQLSRTEQRERRRLALVLHDEVQQLIGAARVQAQWLEQEDVPETWSETLQTIEETLKQALETSRSLSTDLTPSVLHESGLVSALKWFASRIQELHRLSVHLRLDHRAEPDTEELRFLLFECIRELLFNVARHSGVKAAELTLLKSGGRIEATVRDEGKGFDPAAAAERVATEAVFGLFSIRERLSYVGGRMEIHSTPGKGTKISLVLPAAVSEGEETLAQESHLPPSKESSGLCRVLIVEDHEIMREGLVKLLQSTPDLEVVGEAGDGPQAIESAGRLKPDVVIMDVNLGEMGGVETTRRLLAAHPEIGIVGLSMHTDGSVAAAMYEAGASAYLEKGGPSEDLIAAVRSCRP